MSTIMKASHQWATRPADQRFISLTAMKAAADDMRAKALQATISSRTMEIWPIQEDKKALAVVTEHGYSFPTNWAFGQACGLIGAPRSYMEKLPPYLVADCMNYGFAKREVADMGVLYTDAGEPFQQLAAATGPGYTRIWNGDVIDKIMSEFGDGIEGRFRVPGEFGRAVEVDQGNTTLYASDRDMFIFLADETNRVEVPNRRNGQSGSLARGFFVWNSQVGSQTLGVATFLFDFVCCNRIVWGAKEYKTIKVRHTKSANDRWLEEVAPAISIYANASAMNIQEAVKAAQAARIADLDEFFHKRRFTQNQARAISLAHFAEENKPIETVWDAVTGITAYAKGLEHQDARINIERQAGDLLTLVA